MSPVCVSGTGKGRRDCRSLPLASRKLHARNLTLDVPLERTPCVVLSCVQEELSHASLADAVLIGCTIRETKAQRAGTIGRGRRKERAGADEGVVVKLAIIACGHLFFLLVVYNLVEVYVKAPVSAASFVVL